MPRIAAGDGVKKKMMKLKLRIQRVRKHVGRPGGHRDEERGRDSWKWGYSGAGLSKRMGIMGWK